MPATVTRVSGRSAAAASRSAATGGTCEARNAGTSAATSVTPRPTTSDAITAAAGTPIPATFRLPLRADNAAAPSVPMPTPSPSPTSDAMIPMTVASTITDRIT